MKKTFLPILTAALLASVASTQAQTLLRITEAMSNGDIADWFEITNLGNSAYNLENHRMDDNSFAIANSIPLVGISTIGVGESVVFIETSNSLRTTYTNDAGVVTAFKNNWGGLSGTQVGYYYGQSLGVSLSSSGDGVTLYSNILANSGTELPGPFGASSNLIRVSFGAATPGSSFYWSYDGAGVSTSSATGVVTDANAPGALLTWNNSGTAMNATPGTIPEPSSTALLGLGTIALLGLRRLNRKA